MSKECVKCTYFGRAADAPKTVELACMWLPSEENGWDIPCEETEKEETC